SLLRATAFLFAVCASSVFAQDKSKSEEQKAEEYRFTLASLKVQVVFTEYEGDKKLKVLPYSFLVTTQTREGRPNTKIRVGNRVPIYIGGEHNGVTYMDIGTNIDSSAECVAPGQYRLYLSMERSWVEGNVMVPVEKAPSTLSGGGESHTAQFAQPVVRQYKAELTPILKDGQSIETNLATDPLSGRVVKLEVSISVLK